MSDIRVGNKVIYNDGRPGHSGVNGEVVGLFPGGMSVQFEDRAAPSTIRFKDKEWMQHIRVESNPSDLGQYPNNPSDDYEERVRAYEEQGLDRSDAQSVVDAEIRKEKNKTGAQHADWCDYCINEKHPDILMSSANGYETTGTCDRCGRENIFVRPVKVPVPFTASEPIGGEHQDGITSGQGGGMFGGTDLEGPSFHVGFTFRGTRREVSFTTLKEAQAFVKGASTKFGKIASGWTIKKAALPQDAMEPSGNYTYEDISDEALPIAQPVEKTPAHPSAPDWVTGSAKTASILDDAAEYFFQGKKDGNPLADVFKERYQRTDQGDDKYMAISRLMMDYENAFPRDEFGNLTDPDGYAEDVTHQLKQIVGDDPNYSEGSSPAERHDKKFMKDVGIKGGSKKVAVVDPAKRNLILELLGHNPKTTGQIEKALGGGKYTNMAYPILQELAKEGLVSHKQMRWSLKAAKVAKVAKKAYRIGKKALSIETRVTEANKQDLIKTVVDKLNARFMDLKRKNPQGHMDSFEQQLPTFMLDIAKEMRLQMDYKPDSDTYIFYDQTGMGTRNKSFSELSKPELDPNKLDLNQQDKGMFKDMGIKASVKLAKPMPSKGSPEWHQLQIAIQTMKMAEPMVNVMGGPDRTESERILAQYGLRWDEKAYMAGGTGVKKAGDGMAKTEDQVEKEAAEKEAGFNFFFPGQVLTEFYPEIQHEIVDYPNATNQSMSGAGNPEIVGDAGHELEGMLDEALDTNIVEMIQLPADVGDVKPLAMAAGAKTDKQFLDFIRGKKEKEAADYSSTSPAGGMGIGRDGKPEVLEGAPLRKENDIRGQMFTDEFYGQYEGIPGAAMQVASRKTAAGDEVKQFSEFLKKVCGEIAATFVTSFKITQRPLLDKVPGVGEIKLDIIEQGQAPLPMGQSQQGGRVKWLMDKLNDGDIKTAINSSWAQAAVWNDNPDGGFVYEVFVRPETIDTDSLVMKYKFVTGTRG